MDIDVLIGLQNFRNGAGSFLSDFFSKMTFFGELNTVIVIMAIIYWAVSKEYGTFFLMGWSGNRLVNGFLKVTFCAYRPWVRDPRIIPFGNSMTTATGYYTDYAQQGFRLWQIQGYNANQTMTIGKTTCIPFINLLLFTETGSKTIPAGTYPINSSKKVGSVLAGYRNDEKMEINGTMYYYISKSYFSQGYLVPSAQWLIVDGEMTVTDEGWELTGHVRNGNDIHLVGTSAIKAGGAMKAPAKTAEQEADAPQHIISIR